MWRWLKWVLMSLGTSVAIVLVILLITKQFKTVDENNLPKFVKANVVDPSLVVQISKFRSGAGHSNPGWPELCRSMKHYVGVFDPVKKLKRDFDRSKTPDPDYAIDIISPVDGRLSKGSTGEGDDQLNISVDGARGFSIRFEHVHLNPGIGKMAGKVKAGQKIATVWNGQNFDVSVKYNYFRGEELVSYFQVLPDDLFSPWQAQGLQSKSDAIISREYRDAHPLSCDNSRPITPNFVDSNGKVTENWNADNIINLKGFEASVADFQDKNGYKPDQAQTQQNSTPTNQTQQQNTIPAQTQQNITPSQSSSQSGPGPDPQYASLPDISYFIGNPTDQWLMDWDVIVGGHPFKGKRANQPHSGGHIELENQANIWPKNGVVAPANYPPIYAVADGIVTRLTKSLKVGDNDRYGINLAVAKKGDSVVEFEYSIEPMVPEPSPGFYLSYMLVKEGQKVKKGDIIGYFYLPPGHDPSCHIHFELMTTGSGTKMMVPAIFSKEVVHNFYLHWGNWGKDGDVPMPEGMGYMFNAEENPFDTGMLDSM